MPLTPYPNCLPHSVFQPALGHDKHVLTSDPRTLCFLCLKNVFPHTDMAKYIHCASQSQVCLGATERKQLAFLMQMPLTLNPVPMDLMPLPWALGPGLVTSKEGYSKLFTLPQGQARTSESFKCNYSKSPTHETLNFKFSQIRTFACMSGALLVAQTVKNLPAIWETWVQSLGQEDPLEKGMATHSSLFACGSQWTEVPGGL